MDPTPVYREIDQQFAKTYPVFLKTIKANFPEKEMLCVYLIEKAYARMRPNHCQGKFKPEARRILQEVVEGSTLAILEKGKLFSIALDYFITLNKFANKRAVAHRRAVKKARKAKTIHEQPARAIAKVKQKKLCRTEAPGAEKRGWWNLYNHYLESEAWRKFRDHILEKNGHRCLRCGLGGVLQIHHLTYENVGAEQDSDVVVLCRSCHEKAHGRKFS